MFISVLTLMLDLDEHANRFEIYCGKKQHATTPTDLDVHSGASAVLHNLDALMPKVSQSWRVVVTDRFYTSEQLALQLMHGKVY